MNENAIKQKSFQLAVRIIRLSQYLQKEKQEYVLSKQILRSGTSVGANIREAQNAESKADFIHKFSIAQKETDETLYWLELMKETEIITLKEFESIYAQTTKVFKLIRSIILSSKK